MAMDKFTTRKGQIFNIKMDNDIASFVFYEEGRSNNTTVTNYLKQKYPDKKSQIVYSTVANKISELRKAYKVLDEEIFDGNLNDIVNRSDRRIELIQFSRADMKSYTGCSNIEHAVLNHIDELSEMFKDISKYYLGYKSRNEYNENEDFIDVVTNSNRTVSAIVSNNTESRYYAIIEFIKDEDLLDKKSDWITVDVSDVEDHPNTYPLQNEVTVSVDDDNITEDKLESTVREVIEEIVDKSKEDSQDNSLLGKI